MRKIELLNVQSLDLTFQCEFGRIEAMLDAYDLSIRVNSEDECPNCHYGIDLSQDFSRVYHDLHSDEQNDFNIFSIHICPHCHRGFVIEHNMTIKPNKSENDEIVIIEKSQTIYLHSTPNLDIDEQIRKISPKFYDIYRQCLIAKNEGLSDLYGMGFRKALEQLITDFAINKHFAEKDKILAMSLHNRIESYFHDSEAKTALMACKWLGNNETHYENCKTSFSLRS